MPETPNLSDQLVRSFMTEKLQFAPSLVSNMKFANVHRLPRRTDASKISNSTSKRPPPIVVKFCTMRDKMEVLKLAPRSRQFHCAITKHLPISMQRQRKGLMAHANMLFNAGKKIQWKVIDAEYCLFADGEWVKPEARSMPSWHNKSPDSNINKDEACFNYWLSLNVSVHLFLMAVRTLYDCTLYIDFIPLCLIICLATQKLLWLLLIENFQLWRAIPVV